ncbi:MAG: hypothetical protein EH225_11960 [Calditrichaeota bacterium]|nr:hypothetical protein [Calditrichota bacterium]RQV99214.1 MAG: hypothetical protein EH225_11960 [Calditrichota bacterium]
MFEIVVYLLDEKYRDEIRSFFTFPDYFLHIAGDVRDVESICKREIVDLIVIWPANLSVTGDLLKLLKRNNLDFLPVVAVVRSPADFQSLCDLSLKNIIQIPMPRMEFSLLMKSVLKKSLEFIEEETPVLFEREDDSGSLLQSLQTCFKNQDSALISVNAGGHIGRIYIDRGTISKATFRALEGMDALRKLTSLHDTDLNIHYTSIDEEDVIQVRSEEILNSLRSYNQEIAQKLSESRVFADKLFARIPSREAGDDLSKSVLELCRSGESIFTLFAVMNEDNLLILKKVQDLMKEDHLVSTASIAEISKTKMPRGFVGRLLDNFLQIFHRKQKSEISQSAEPEIISLNQNQPEQIPENIATDGLTSGLDNATAEKIEEFISRV